MTNYERYQEVCKKYNNVSYPVNEIFRRSRDNQFFKNYCRGFMSETDMYNGLHLAMMRYEELSSVEKIEVWEVAAYLDPYKEEFYLPENYPEEYKTHTTPNVNALGVDQTFIDLYRTLETASHMSEDKKVRAYGTEGLDILTSMFLNYFNENTEVDLYFQNNAELAGTIKIQNKTQILSLISIGYMPVPTK